MTIPNDNELKQVSRRTLRVLLADDDDLVLSLIPQVLKKFPDIEVVATAKNGSEVLTLVKKYTVDVVLMDVDMPQMNGIEATRWLVRDHPETKILVFTAFEYRPSVMEAVQAGAVGFITKDTPAEGIAEAIRRVSRNEPVVSQAPAEAMFQMVRAQPLEVKPDPEFREAVDSLSPQQKKVYTALVEGKSNKQIAKQLGLKEITVRDYVSQILARSGCASRSEVTVRAFQNNLTTLH